MMQFSCAYKKRKHYVKRLQVPPFSEAKRQLGNELAQVLLDECPTSLKTHMRLTAPLRGPGAHLWTSPSDLLIGKVVLKPPLTGRHVKALTHEGILNIGEAFEAQWLLAVETEQRLATANLEQLLTLLAERDKERAVRDALRACETEFRRHLAAVNGEFEALLVAELAALERSMREYYERLIDEQVNACHQMQADYVDEQIEDAVNATVDNLTRKFLADLEAQEAELEAMYRARLDGQHERHLQAMQHQETVFSAVLKQLKHSLQCNNIASLTYVLCLERRKCMREKQGLVNATLQHVRALEVANDGKRAEIARLRCDLKRQQRKLDAREQCLLGVMGQFQKFVNYALRAAPTQAEFLLSVEKMMTLEVTRALATTTSSRRRQRTGRFLMPWRRAPASDEDIRLADDASYHDCLREADAPKCTDDVADEELLLLEYNDRLYVREDFRNRLTRASQPKDGGALWSKDVEAYVRLMQAVSMDAATVACDDDDADDADDAYPPPFVAASKMTHGQSSVTFLPSMEAAPIDTVGLLAAQDSVQLQRPDDAPPLRTTTSAPEVVAASVNVALLAATDSVTLLKEKHGASLVLARPVDAEERELQVIPAPSTATIQIVKHGPRRRTSCSEDDDDGTCSVASLRLQIRKSGDGERPKEKTPAQAQSSKTSAARRPILSMGAPAATVAERKSPLAARSGVSSHRSTIRDHVDSLELVTAHQIGTTQRIKHIIRPAPAADPDYPTTQLVLNAPAETRDFPNVDFKQVADVFSELYRPEKPWQIYARSKPIPKAASVAATTARLQQPEDAHNFLRQPHVAKVMGAPDETATDFAVHRARSILDVLKKDDSLIRLFTRCTQ